MVAWSDEKALRELIAAHYRVSATHVCVTPVRSEGSPQERAPH
jgi:hypothetical protein